jgi:hypothetical protein
VAQQKKYQCSPGLEPRANPIAEKTETIVRVVRSLAVQRELREASVLGALAFAAMNASSTAPDREPIALGAWEVVQYAYV